LCARQMQQTLRPPFNLLPSPTADPTGPPREARGRCLHNATAANLVAHSFYLIAIPRDAL
ncbi:hypothetical protein, partial [Vogesella indigofera]